MLCHTLVPLLILFSLASMTSPAKFQSSLDPRLKYQFLQEALFDASASLGFIGVLTLCHHTIWIS